MVKRWSGRKVTRNLQLVLQMWGDTCHICGRPGADTADHLIPRSRGGDELRWVVELQRPAHRSCNSSRGNRYKARRMATETVDERAFFEPGAAGEPRPSPDFARPRLKIRDEA